MGMIDVNTKFSAAQAVTSTGDTASTNIYDNGSANTAEIGQQGETWLNVSVSETVTSGGSATVAAVLQDSADASTWADVIVGAAIPKATLVAGYQAWAAMGRPPVRRRSHKRRCLGRPQRSSTSVPPSKPTRANRLR